MDAGFAALRPTRLTVIIPTANRPQRLKTLVSQLASQHFPGPFEVIVVDDYGNLPADVLPASTDRCAFRLIVGARGGPAHARNLGAAQATGQWLIFIDDDSEVDPGYLSQAAHECGNRLHRAITGPQRSCDTGCLFALASESLLNHFSAEQRLGGACRFATSNGFIVSRTAFQELGGFRSAFPLAAGEDRDFCARWLAAGWQIDFADQLSIRHHYPSDFISLMKQQWRYGRGAAQLQALGTTPVRIRPAGFYARMLRRPIAERGLGKGTLIALLCALSQAALVLGYAVERCSASTTAAEDGASCPTL